MFASVPLVLTFVNELAPMKYECQNRDTRKHRPVGGGREVALNIGRIGVRQIAERCVFAALDGKSCRQAEEKAGRGPRPAPDQRSNYLK